jgi:hypothetical protein
MPTGKETDAIFTNIIHVKATIIKEERIALIHFA